MNGTYRAAPGPWVVVGTCIYAEGRGLVANVRGTHPLQDAANAQLIAASPKMLETLQAIESWWLQKGMHVLGAPPPCILEARQAIAKAMTVTVATTSGEPT